MYHQNLFHKAPNYYSQVNSYQSIWFIKGRTIQYCLAWAFQFLHLCHHSKKEIVILKLDFEKAFDKVEHQAILQILKHKGFSEKLVGWIDNILSSGTSSFYLMASLENLSIASEGSGDPLSPFLFVLVADLLQPL